MSKVRTRFAPSPTGRMHVGNLRSALYEFLIAKHAGGDFMLRIEDTDQERYVEGAVEIIYRTLQETGLVHDEGPDKDGGYGPYVQSERMKTGIYMKYAKELIEKGEAYYCFCDKERLASLKTEVVEGKEITLYDKHCLHLSKEEIEVFNQDSRDREQELYELKQEVVDKKLQIDTANKLVEDYKTKVNELQKRMIGLETNHEFR